MGDRFDSIDFQLIRLFLEVARAGSFFTAASNLDLERSTIKKRIDKLEAQLNIELFTRSQNGVILTPQGEIIYNSALRFIESGYAFRNTVDQTRRRRSLCLTIDAPDGIASLWLTPALSAILTRSFPISIEITSNMDMAFDERDEPKVLINFAPHVSASYSSARIARLHLRAFASVHYQERNGTPKNHIDWTGHSFVVLRRNYMKNDLFEIICNRKITDTTRVFYASNGAMHLSAIRAGFGIGILPTYVAALASDIVYIPTENDHYDDLYIHYKHECVDDNLAFKLIGAIKAAFDPTKYPWFRDDFTSPSEFAPPPPWLMLADSGQPGRRP